MRSTPSRMSRLMEVPSLRRMSAADEAFKALHDMIMSGQLKNGDKLPSQDKLAVQFGLSRNTIREAINKLTAMGLLAVRQGVGTLINISSPSAYMASLADHLLLQPSTVRDFMEARAIVEIAAVRLAVSRADSESIARLEVNVANQRNAIRNQDVQAFVAYDVDFHTSLARLSGNTVLLQFLGAITDLLGQFIMEVSLLPRATDNALSFHCDILKLIRLRDADGAGQKMIEHLQDVLINIEKSTGMELGTTLHLRSVLGKP